MRVFNQTRIFIGEIMNKIIILFVTTIFLSSCASVKNKFAENKKHSVAISNSMEIQFDDQGNFLNLTSTASSPITINLPNSKDTAIISATLKARSNISEFLSSDISSESFVNKLSNSFNENMATKVSENISSKSTSILKGTFVSSTIFDDKNKLVIVTVESNQNIQNKFRLIENAITY
tara:strand:+ start:1194 stop:1727 length:534 start_codon:yes stop_codon:yes gene_type:complete